MLRTNMPTSALKKLYFTHNKKFLLVTCSDVISMQFNFNVDLIFITIFMVLLLIKCILH